MLGGAPLMAAVAVPATAIVKAALQPLCRRRRRRRRRRQYE